jgi:hypothetical protein
VVNSVLRMTFVLDDRLTDGADVISATCRFVVLRLEGLGRSRNAVEPATLRLVAQCSVPLTTLVGTDVGRRENKLILLLEAN